MKTRLGSDAFLVGRQLLMMTLMPLMKERPEQPMDGEKLAVPFEALEHGFLHRQLLDTGRVHDDDETVPLPRVHKDAITPEQLQALVLHTPVIIEGLLDDEMLQRWSFDRLKQNFGSARLTVTNPDLTEYRSTIGEMVDAVVAGDKSGKYVRSASDVFLEQPELLDQLPFDDMKRYLGKLGHYFGAEFFIGGAGTGTPFHCAPFFNFFNMIHGVKDWLFVHPSYSRWIYPILHHMGYGVSRVRHRNPDELREKYPLYLRIPKLSARLQPGDTLINPPWWWHAVDNMSPSSIGIATRWAEPRLTQFNPTFELVGQLNKAARDLHRNAAAARVDGRQLRDSMWRDRFHLKPPSFATFTKR